MKLAFFERTEQDFALWLSQQGEASYRFGQVRDWIVRHRQFNFTGMTSLSKSLREALASDWVVLATQIAVRSKDADHTVKLLLRLSDGQMIECVLLKEEQRRTLCMSTQVGCGMGCVFCASGLNGVERNLTSGEMIEQMLQIAGQLPSEERLDHIVVMGMGEPLANLDNLLEALQFATSPKGMGIGARNITISTVGLPAKMKQLAETGRSYHLAVSLHAPNNELRQRIVPTAGKVDLDEILVASDAFRAETGRQVTFEYVMLADLNDHPDHARELASRLGHRDAMVNLIPYNPVAGLGYATPRGESVQEFAAILRREGFTVKVRKKKGSGIDAACGQLRRQQASQNPLPVVDPVG